MEEILSKSTNGLRKVGLASLAVTLTLGASVMSAGAANADADFEFKRIGGSDRYETSSLVAGEYGSYDTAILANGEPGNYVDALAANYLSGMKKAPVLLTRVDDTPDDVLNELKDKGVKNVYVVGGESKISAEQVEELEEAGYTVTRVSGEDRFETNAKILAEGGKGKDTAIVATGFEFADALAGGPAVYNGHPVGLTYEDDIEDVVIDALKEAGATKAIILGGENAVSEDVEMDLEEEGIETERVFGNGRSETSTAFANYAIKNLGFTDTAANVATGYTESYGADALAGGPLTGMKNRPMLITRDVENSDHLEGWFKNNANKLTEGTIFGGKSAVSVAAEADLEEAAQTVTSNQDYSATPAEAATNEVSKSATSNEGARQYAVSGLDNATTYDLELFPAENVTVDDNGVVTFADEDGARNAGNGYADKDVDNDDSNGTDENDVIADIEVVNGSSQVDARERVEVKPVNGQITFTVDSENADSVVPVVYADGQTTGAGADNLDLDDSNQPSEMFAVGGAKTWVPAESQTTELTTDEVIESADKAADQIITVRALYNYDANDRFYIEADGGNDADATEQVTLSEFEAQLSADDSLSDGTIYQSNPELSSTFLLDDTAPAAPGALTPSKTTDTSTTLTVAGVESLTTPVTIYGEVDSAPGTEDVEADETADPPVEASTDETAVSDDSDVYATAQGDQDASTAGYQVNVTGLTANTTYDFAATQTVSGEESELGTERENVTTAVAGSTVAPKLLSADLEEDAVLEGRVTANDVFSLVFNEDVVPFNNEDGNDTQGGTEAFASFDLTDADGDTFRVQCFGTQEAADAAVDTTDNGVTAAFCETQDSEDDGNPATGVPTDDTDDITNDELLITLAEDAEDRNSAGDGQAQTGGIDYAVTLNTIDNVYDFDGNEATLADAADVTID
jgi:putative cell wall-binding protein